MFLSNLNVEPDELHVIHLGTSMYFLGSVLWMLIFRILRDGSVAARVEAVWKRISLWYSVFQPADQFTNLSLASFCDASKPFAHFPKPKGKVGEVKGLVEPLARVWSELSDVSNPDHTLIEIGFRQLISMQSIISEYGKDLFVPPPDVLVLQDNVHEFLRVYTELGHSADRQKLYLFNMTHKFHVLLHFAERAQYLCPRRGACLLDEDYVGKMKVVAQACSSGTELHHIPGKIAQKVRWGRLCIRKDNAIYEISMNINQVLLRIF